MILGYIGMIDRYVLGEGLLICPRKTLSDVCEHLFAKMRFKAASTDKPTLNSCHLTCARSSLLQQGIRGSNCQYGPKINETVNFGRRNRY